MDQNIPRTAAEGASVPPLATFRGTNEHGATVFSHPALPNKVVEPRYYFCTLPTANMHRPDGVKIAFFRGIAEVIVEASQQYMNKEIEEGNMYVSHATEDQINRFKMERDPRGTITEQVKKELEPELRRQLSEEIHKEYEEALKTTNDGKLIAGTDEISKKLAAMREARGNTEGSNVSVVNTQRLGGISNTENIKPLAAGN